MTRDGRAPGIAHAGQVPRDIVILGNGVASLTAVQTLRREGFRGSVTVVSDERDRSYARMLTPYYVSGRLSKEQLHMVSPDYHRSLGVEAILGAGAVQVDAGNRWVILADGRRVPYDRLLVATGGRPYLPDIPGIGSLGVLGLRSMKDAEEMTRLVCPGEPAVVLGGGLVALMAAEGLAVRGMSVTVVVTSCHALSQILAPEAAALVEAGLTREGLRLLKGRDAVEVQRDAGGRVAAVRLDNGEILPCRVLVIGKGVRPCVEALRGTGLTTGNGLTVNKYLETGQPGVFGAGDVAEAPDLLDGRPRVVATQTNAVQQGKTAALNMIGVRLPDPGGLPINSAHFGGVRMVTAGSGDARAADREEVISRNGTDRRYLFREDRLVGFSLVGDVSNAGRLIGFIRGKVPLGGKLRRVLDNTLTGPRRGEI